MALFAQTCEKPDKTFKEYNYTAFENAYWKHDTITVLNAISSLKDTMDDVSFYGRADDFCNVTTFAFGLRDPSDHGYYKTPERIRMIRKRNVIGALRAYTRSRFFMTSILDSEGMSVVSRKYWKNYTEYSQQDIDKLTKLFDSLSINYVQPVKSCCCN